MSTYVLDDHRLRLRVEEQCEQGTRVSACGKLNVYHLPSWNTRLYYIQGDSTSDKITVFKYFKYLGGGGLLEEVGDGKLDEAIGTEWSPSFPGSLHVRV
jgi:hypothetical protein